MCLRQEAGRRTLRSPVSRFVTHKLTAHVSKSWEAQACCPLCPDPPLTLRLDDQRLRPAARNNLCNCGHSADVSLRPGHHDLSATRLPMLAATQPQDLWRHMRSRARALWRPDLLLVLCLLGFAIGKRLVLLPSWTQLDLDVYRRGASALAGGRPLYELVSEQYPFTYPPFAAIVMLPLGYINRTAAIAAMAFLSLAAFAVICGTTIRLLHIDRRMGWFLALGAMSLQPVYQTFELGQVNLIIMALIMLDCLVLPPRYRGIGVGLAAAIKIVPGIFVLYFILRRDWKAVARSGITFSATVLVSLIITPHETVDYWTNLVGDASRTGDTISSVNQSLPAVIARLTHDRYPPAVVVVLVSLCGIVLAVLAARKQLTRGHDLAALVSIAIGGLLASPVSWSHHYVWAVPALMILFLEKHTVAAALGAAIFYVAPMQLIRFGYGVELTYGPWEQFVSAAYPLAAAAWLASRLFTQPSPASPSPTSEDQPAWSNGDHAQDDSQQQYAAR